MFILLCRTLSQAVPGQPRAISLGSSLPGRGLSTSLSINFLSKWSKWHPSRFLNNRAGLCCAEAGRGLCPARQQCHSLNGQWAVQWGWRCKGKGQENVRAACSLGSWVPGLHFRSSREPWMVCEHSAELYCQDNSVAVTKTDWEG